MKTRCLFLVFIILSVGVCASAQTRSVTNSSLESYKQERLKGEQEYRDNYARLGLPSPEELDRRREQSRIETEQLSAKLRAANLERERLAAEQRANEQLAAAYYRQAQLELQPTLNSPFYFWPKGRRHWFPLRKHYVQPGYFAGGQFWPTGPSSPPRPMFAPHR